jgi:hypothetical protein
MSDSGPVHLGSFGRDQFISQRASEEGVSGGLLRTIASPQAMTTNE